MLLIANLLTLEDIYECMIEGFRREEYDERVACNLHWIGQSIVGNIYVWAYNWVSLELGEEFIIDISVGGSMPGVNCGK